MEAFVRRLPDGWASYPACRARASLLASLASARALDGLDGLPEPLTPYVDITPEGWLPEVVHVGMLLALRDLRFSGLEGEEAFLGWLHRLNGDLLPDRSDLGPARAVLEFPRIWSSLHEGTTIEIVETGPSHALLAAIHPEPLFPSLASRWRRDAIGGFLARAGAVQPRVMEIGRVDDRLNIAITWT